jgi:DNA-binding MarR family transcriptional regulator
MRTSSTRRTPKKKTGLIEQIVQRQRQHSIAVVLFHQAVAARLGIGPTDHKCLDLLREHGVLTGSELAALTGLTTGAVTGVVARLERAGFLNRQAHPHDRRKQILCSSRERMQDIRRLFDPIRMDMTALLERFDPYELAAIAEFLTHSTDLTYRQTALLRSGALHREAGTHDSTNATGHVRRP